MNIEIEDRSGFCFGVKSVVEMAEEILNKGEKLYCLGQLVHNEEEVKRLHDKGLIVIDHQEFAALKNAMVLIRAHGEPPETYRIARENNIKLIDGTCPIVRALQKRIRKNFVEISDEGGQLILYGKKDHPEVRGLNGQINNQAIVITKPEEIFDFDLKDPVRVFSQTTMDTEGYNKLEGFIREKMEDSGLFDLKVKNSICGHISHRAPGMRKFAAKHQLVVFVSGKRSSNGRLLYEVSKSVNPETYFISVPGELKSSWFHNIDSVGIAGATSTPIWLLEEVARVVKSFT